MGVDLGTVVERVVVCGLCTLPLTPDELEASHTSHEDDCPRRADLFCNHVCTCDVVYHHQCCMNAGPCSSEAAPPAAGCACPPSGATSPGGGRRGGRAMVAGAIPAQVDGAVETARPPQELEATKEPTDD